MGEEDATSQDAQKGHPATPPLADFSTIPLVRYTQSVDA
jgi:hypothetical protein